MFAGIKTLICEASAPLLEWIAAELPARESEALVLTKVYGYSREEAASLLDNPPAAVKMARSRARCRLRKIGVSSRFAQSDDHTTHF